MAHVYSTKSYIEKSHVILLENRKAAETKKENKRGTNQEVMRKK